MVSERERAIRLGIPSPIHPNIDETHKAYNAALEYVIEKQSLFHKSPESVRGLCLVVASHNHHSIENTCELMGKYGIPRNAGWVSFGQLLGMQDGVTGHLASNGFKALKYVPYGPVPVVIPYLHRRAQENGAMVEAMSSDKQAIKKEIKIRLGFN
jgi:proline dehydrogenase